MSRIDASVSGRSAGFDVFAFTAFYLSGVSSLGFEVIWSKQLGYMLGVDVYAATTVVMAFMGGLGLGAWLAARYAKRIPGSLPTYGLLQIGIGLFGILSIPLFQSVKPLLTFLYRWFHYDSAAFLLIRFLIVFGFLMVPVTLMGMTLPVLISAVYERSSAGYETVSGKLYGFNTVGAVLGTLVAGFAVVPVLGLMRSALLFGVLDCTVGVSAIVVGRRLGRTPAPMPSGTRRQRSSSGRRRTAEVIGAPSPEPAVGRSSSEPSSWWVRHWSAWVFLLSGASALSYEMLWFRLLARIVGPTVHAFSIMLAVYLMGIGIGSLVGTRLLRYVDSPRRAMAWTLMCIGVYPIATLFFLNELPIWYGIWFGKVVGGNTLIGQLSLQSIVASLMMLPSTIAMGALFPIVVKEFASRNSLHPDESKSAVGVLYSFNTVGAMIGSLVTGFWLMPLIGIRAIMMVASGVNMMLAALVAASENRFSIGRRMVPVAVAGAAMVLAMLSPGMDQSVLNAGLYSEMLDQQRFVRHVSDREQSFGKLLFFHEGIGNSVAVIADKFNDGNLTLHFNGIWEASTEIHGRLHLKFLGHLPMMFASDPKRIAVVGFGAGITTGAVLSYAEARQVDVFELEPAVIQANRYFEYINGNPLADSRVRLFLVDGRSHLSYSTERYDVITSDPIHPFVAGSANLYTLDYYRMMADRLNPGGIFCQWIPMVGISAEAYDVILRTMGEAFPHVAMFTFFGESVILASKDPVAADWKRLEQRFYEPKVFADLKRLDISTPYNLPAFFMTAHPPSIRNHGDKLRVNTDDNVWLEHRVPFDALEGRGENLFFGMEKRLGQSRDIEIPAVFAGISMRRLEAELSALKKNGELAYRMAQQAARQGDVRTMEIELRKAITDFNNIHLVPACLQLAELLLAEQRTDELLEIVDFLQYNYPAYSEGWILAARGLMAAGKTNTAKAAAEKGLMYNPNDKRLLEVLAKTTETTG